MVFAGGWVGSRPFLDWEEVGKRVQFTKRSMRGGLAVGVVVDDWEEEEGEKEWILR